MKDRLDIKHSLIFGTSLILLIGGCAETVSTDPKEGGLIGGIHGLSSGKYEERIEQREERLERLKTMQKELDEEKTALEEEKEAKRIQMAKLQKDLEALHKKTKALAIEVDGYQATLSQEKNKHEDLQRKLSQLQDGIKSLSERSNKGKDVQRLEEERAALEKEYELLLDIYRELSQ